MYYKEAEKKFGKLTDDQLNARIEADEHLYYAEEEEDDFSSSGEIHAENECDVCGMENLLAHRERVKESKSPGAMPFFEASSMRTISASELKDGMIARVLPNPGSPRAYYAQCTFVAEVNGQVHSLWRKTNTYDHEFMALYGSDWSINVIEELVITKRTTD